jgi:hypothetical protein
MTRLNPYSLEHHCHTTPYDENVDADEESNRIIEENRLIDWMRLQFEARGNLWKMQDIYSQLYVQISTKQNICWTRRIHLDKSNQTAKNMVSSDILSNSLKSTRISDGRETPAARLH